MLDYTQINDIVVDGIDGEDYPDFCDAYIASATYKGLEMTYEELEELNVNREFVYDEVIKSLT